MAIIFKEKVTKPPLQVVSLKNLRPEQLGSVNERNRSYVTKRDMKLENSGVLDEKTIGINNGIIKPKYIKDSNVVYKTSGYVKDLLGEGN